MVLPRTQVPELSVETLNGETWNVHQQDGYSVIFFYRGYHCPICRSQLRDIDRHFDDFNELDVNVIAISSNPRQLAEKTRDEWELENLNIGYGLSLDKARKWGLYISNSIKPSEPDQFSEPGIFLIQPNGRLYASIISTMPFARPSTSQVVHALGKMIKEGYPARGEVG